MTNAAVQTKEEIAQEQQDKADFLAEFNNTEAVAPVAAASTEEPAKVETVDDPGEPIAQAPDAGAQAAEDPWKDVPPVLRQTLADLNTKIGSIEHMTKSSAGRVGALQSALDEARKSATKQGAPAPSAEEIQAAASSDEEWKKLEDEYGEWAIGFRKQMVAMEQRLLKKVPNVDTGAITHDVLNKSREYAHLVGTEVKKVIPLYVKHPDWESTTKTPEFIEWAHENGPSDAERKQKWQLESADPQRAAAYTNELIRKYPQWWAERGSLCDSDSPMDAIKMMDAYNESQAAKAAEQDPPADPGRQEKNQQRLARATAPTKGAIKPKPANKTEHDEFLEEFNNPN